MHKARIYFRIAPPPSDPTAPEASPSSSGRESGVGFNESSIMSFIHDPTHRYEVLNLPEKTRESVEKVLAQKFPHSNPVIESISWLT